MTDKHPKISIIIPVYNAEKYLPRCIDSILSQTITDFELLLIDDCSKDNSGKICDEYAFKDERINVFHQTFNKGASGARNVGINKAKGKYISFIDSDDWIESTYYSDFFENEVLEYDIYFQNFVCHYQDGSTKFKEIMPYSATGEHIDEAILYLMKEIKFGWSWIKLFRNSIIQKHNIKFDESISLREDELFTLQYCKYINSISIKNKANYHYYIYEESLTRRFRDPIEFIRISKILMKESSYLNANGIKEYEETYFLENLYNALLRLYINGKLSHYNKDKRFSVINEFLSYYFSHRHIPLNYKSRRSKFMYSLLWHTHSPKAIDYIMQKWFSVSYSE